MFSLRYLAGRPGALAGVLALVLAFAGLLSMFDGSRTYERTIQRIGYPTNMRQLWSWSRELPNRRDIEAIYASAANRVTASYPFLSHGLESVYALGDRDWLNLPPESLDACAPQLREFLELNQPSLDMVYRESGQNEISLRRWLDALDDYLVEDHYSQLAWLLRLDTLRQVADHNPEGAFTALGTQLRLAEELARVPAAELQMRSDQVATRAMDSLCHAVNRLEFSDEQLSKLQDALYRLYTLAPKRHWDTIAVSLARNNSAFDDPFARTYYRGALWSLDLLWRLSGGQSLHRLAMVREHRYAMQQLLQESGPRVLAGGLFNTLWFGEPLTSQYARTRLDLARAGLALKRYYLKYRKFPEHLREVAPEFLA
ncbi:MAG: hypothetical protein HYV26_02910, partial [Candidatus Hydrogenedentes bacterium]|nr:hypothetical protein [Candidatus Hydrogenedentota bacterium]